MLTDKAPYFVTISIAALGWAITHMVDRLLNTPMIKYSEQKISSNGEETLFLTFKNITRDKTFKKLQIILTAPSDGVIKSGAVIPVQPAWEGDQPYQVAGRTFEFTFPEFQPGWEIEISANYTGSAQPSLRLSSPEQTVYAIRPSLKSWLVENDVEVLTGLAAVGALVLIWIIVLQRKPKSEPRRYD
jgi:hypothetical protein